MWKESYWRYITGIMFTALVLFAGLGVISASIEDYEIKINQSYLQGLNEGFQFGIETQSNFTNNYIVQNLQQQGFIVYPLTIGNESLNIKLGIVQ